MRIGIEAQRITRRKKHGMDIVALELIKKLQTIDKVNEYFVFTQPDEDMECIPIAPNFNTIALKRAPYPVWEQVLLPYAVKKYKCDILHCTSNTAPIFGNTPLILTLHDIIFLEKNSYGKGRSLVQSLGNLYRRLIVPFVFKKSAEVITVSNTEKNLINNHFKAGGKKISVVFNGKNEHFLDKINEKQALEIIEKYSLPNNFLLFLGNTDPKKNTRRVIYALYTLIKKHNWQIPLVMPDLGEKYLKSILEKEVYITTRPLLHLTGYIENKDLPAIYQQSLMFLYPSIRESFGIPIIEAMASGTPVITSNTSCLPEIANGAALLTDPFDESTMAASIVQLKEDIPLRKSLIARGIRVSRKYNWENMAIEVADIYTKIFTTTRIKKELKKGRKTYNTAQGSLSKEKLQSIINSPANYN